MPDTLLVYNLCGLRKNNIETWQKNIDDWLKQKQHFDLCISACNVQFEESKKILKEKYKDHKITFIEDILPVNVTFNFNCKLYPNYKYFVYTASDVNPKDNKDIIPKVKKFHIENNNAMTGAFVTGDCLPPNFQKYEKVLASGQDVTFKAGEAFNCHFCMFDKILLDNFNKLIPDVFRSWCTESVFFYVCESLEKRLGMLNSKDVKLYHPDTSNDLDGNSVGFQDRKGPEDLFNSKKTARERLMSNAAAEAGFGYEEIKYLFPHDKKLYKDGRHINPKKLKDFVKTGVYLTDEEFNYKNVKHVIN
tara:strand:+ start:33 stop:947 length:915 start_codon:yes stop_codon:yes gene_type:complete